MSEEDAAIAVGEPLTPPAEIHTTAQSRWASARVCVSKGYLRGAADKKQQGLLRATVRSAKHGLIESGSEPLEWFA